MANRKAKLAVERQKRVDTFDISVVQFFKNFPSFQSEGGFHYLEGADGELRVEPKRKGYYSVRLKDTTNGELYEFRIDVDKFTPTFAFEEFIQWIAKYL